MVRSCLFVPAHNHYKINKAIGSDADSIILDLEDAVPPDKKEEARENTIITLCNNHVKPIGVRVNSLTSPFLLDDLTRLVEGAREKLTMVCIPKIESDFDIKNIDWFLTRLEEKNNIPIGTVGIYPIIESALGLTNIEKVAFASNRIKQIHYGMVDYTSDLNLVWPYNGSEQIYIRTKVSLVSRAAGLEAPLDTLWPIISDEKGLMEDCLGAKALGYQGKTVVHPSQIEVVNRVFTPSTNEINHAKHILSELEKAEQNGNGAVRLTNGQFIDYASIEKARKIMELAEQLKIGG